MKKKRHTSTPRHKRMNRQSRLQAAPHWIPKYDGKNLVHGYAKHFGVNKLAAVVELELLGYPIDVQYKQLLKQDEIRKEKEAHRRKAKALEGEEIDEWWWDEDGPFF
ncbi:hypothetical protein [Rossellomorea vietnamensis]|uniref:Uncharacterized protein n=1 Tax=Rossellomorea vietnamensis TaxID=218284 RepID=A0A0P6W2Z3_9BACI|nr:hypothetical protein [Rossellomorea vietnamensis]KPL60467.1 hypothetical protein AM506_04870 [Rossellomorea vietnamensis]